LDNGSTVDIKSDVDVCFFVFSEVRAITDLVLLSSNLEYMERFSRYIRLSAWEKLIRIHQFSSLDALARFLQTGGQAQVVLCESHLHDACMQLFAPEETLIVGLTGQPADAAGGQLEIAMYQPVSRLLRKLERFRAEHMPDGKPDLIVADRTNSTPANPLVKVAVASPYGGSGVTTIACHLAKLLAMRLEKVLYLNLDLYPEPVMATDIDYDFSRFLYALMTRPERIAGEWQQYCGRHPVTGVYTFRPPTIRRDLRDVNTEHIHRICAFFQDIGFQAVVLDLDAHWLDDLAEGKIKVDESWLILPWQRKALTDFPQLRTFAERSQVRLILNQVNGPHPVPTAAESPFIEAVLPHLAARGEADPPYQSSERFESIISRLILDSTVLGGLTCTG